MIEVKIDFKDAISSGVNKIKKDLDNLPKEAVVEYRNLTPKKSGNARRKTTLKGNTIQANYPYAGRLDEGYSKQAPNGMTKPWEQWLQKRIKQIMGR
jgi:hypothetical protein